MPVKVLLPTVLQRLTNNEVEVQAEGGTVREVVDDLERRYPGLKERLCDETGRLRRFVNIYVNNEDIRHLANEETPLKEGDEVSVVPSIAGGASPPGAQRE
ncbi:MAG: MoaD/ThiS family protein [Armatimonadetes bacterium]|nr:MoaD/ThiS family protein [Armatimonadota bacterium]